MASRTVPVATKRGITDVCCLHYRQIDSTVIFHDTGATGDDSAVVVSVDAMRKDEKTYCLNILMLLFELHYFEQTY